MISKAQIKTITSLQQKKYRNSLGLFIAEGPKVIDELIASGIELHSLFSTKISEDTINHFKVSEKELKKITCLTNANTSLALFKTPHTAKVHCEGLIVALDAVRDPGNLGTIIRLCDWFGVKQLWCSQDTVDCFNPKVVQATMGSIARVLVHYIDLEATLKKSDLPIYGGAMDGVNVYKQQLPKEGIVVLGNEANGISDEIFRILTHRISIPQFGSVLETESLNVATATAILLSEFCRSTEM